MERRAEPKIPQGLFERWLAERYLHGENVGQLARRWRYSERDMRRAIRRGRDALMQDVLRKFATEYEQNLDLARIDAMFPPTR
jgi:hypothetical protein